MFERPVYHHLHPHHPPVDIPLCMACRMTTPQLMEYLWRKRWASVPTSYEHPKKLLCCDTCNAKVEQLDKQLNILPWTGIRFRAGREAMRIPRKEMWDLLKIPEDHFYNIQGGHGLPGPIIIARYNILVLQHNIDNEGTPDRFIKTLLIHPSMVDHVRHER